LIFFGVPGNVHHVAISLGGTAIVHAPDFGQPVQVGDYRVFKDVLAVSRPAGVAGGYPAGTATGNG
jgi:cell wall-associated NlpC family hydrolase